MVCSPNWRTGNVFELTLGIPGKPIDTRVAPNTLNWQRPGAQGSTPRAAELRDVPARLTLLTVTSYEFQFSCAATFAHPATTCLAP